MIRAATVDDAAAIDRVQRRCLIQAFADVLDVDDLLASRPGEAGWRQALERDDCTIWVWDQDGMLAGFVSAGAWRAGASGVREGEIHAICVDPAAQGAGVGTALLARAVEWLRSAGLRVAALWTLEADGAGRAFLERRGWQSAGGDTGAPGDAASRVRYRAAL